MFASKDLFLTRPSGYQISRSVRLRSSASAYLNRTMTTPTLGTKWTWSGWCKLGTVGTRMVFFSAGGSNGHSIALDNATSANANLTLYAIGTGTAVNVASANLLRDPSAWYHIVVAVDTTQATASNRVLLYVNGVVVTSFASSSYPTQNSTLTINASGAHNIGRRNDASFYYDGYLTEINFIDGQALTPSSFGETNTVTGVWQPIKYTGTYGTNGFYLNFSDNSGVTATTIGKDYSGNGNNWTPNNISVTAGATYDSMLDSPTPYADGGNGRGNYCVLNPISLAGVAPTNGNLSIPAVAGTTYYNVMASMAFPTSGLFYFEATLGTANYASVGIHGLSATWSSSSSTVYVGSASAEYSIGEFGFSDFRTTNNATSTATGVTVVNNAVIGIAFDASTGKIWFAVNGTWVNSGNPSSGTNPAYTVSADTYVPAFTVRGNQSQSVNFGQRPFTYTPPTGFVALNTQNLPTPTISNGATVMAATTYTGTGSALTIANTVGNASFQPDLVWVKGRSGATDHAWYDAVRGVQKQLESNTTTAETTETTGLTAFGSTGFTVGALTQMNTNTATYVAWQWNAGGSTVTNTSGSISAQVRANATAGFSVVTYTGTGANATVGHGLGVAPSMMIFKNRNTAGAGWVVWHTSFVTATTTDYLLLNSTGAKGSLGAASFWNGVSTSTVLNIGTDSWVNQSATPIVAYCFSAVAGYSAFGKYTGNGNSSDGPFVFTNFRPRWVMIKRTDTAGENWEMWDSSRGAYNIDTPLLYANLSNAETAGSAARFDALSNGFKIRSTNAGVNASGGTYIYAAFSEVGFKYALGR